MHNLGEPRSWWSGHPRLGAAENDYPCPGNALAMWINRTDVRLALGVDPNSYYFSGDNGVGFNYRYGVVELAMVFCILLVCLFNLTHL